jgi:hypothetical protein
MRGKAEEADNRRSQKYIRMGEDNAEIIRKAESWCTHIRFGQMARGLLAEATGLPIGRHELSCPHAEGGFQAMDLKIILPDFVVRFCGACKNRQSKGGESWGLEIIESAKAQQLVQEKETEVRREQLAAVREELSQTINNALSSVESRQREILVLIEKLFSDEPKRQETSDLLVSCARIGAELFSQVAIDILVDQSLSAEFAQFCLPICRELAERLPNMSARIAGAAVEAIERTHCKELAAGVVLVLPDGAVSYPLNEKTISELIEGQYHYRDIGSTARAERVYTDSTQLLVKCYDADSDSVNSVFKRFLAIDDKFTRINACGSLGLVQAERPKIGIDLLPAIVASLELPDDGYEDSADARARDRIVQALKFDRRYVDDFLMSELQKRRLAVQQEIVDAYGRLANESFWDAEGRRHVLKAAENDIRFAVARCVDFLQNESLDVYVRDIALEALNALCHDNSDFLADRFDQLLGYYVIISSVDEPTQPPKIIIPDEIQKSPVVVALEKNRQRQTWDFMKGKLLSVLKRVAQNGTGTNIAKTICQCFECLDTKTDEDLKGSLMEMLGEIGKNFSCEALVLPTLWRGLMDFGSAILRRKSIDAIGEMYRWGPKPPENVVEALITLMRDSFLIVHLGAIRVVGDHPDWLGDRQAAECVELISARFDYYSKAYREQLKNLCEAAISIGRHFGRFDRYVFGLVIRVFPTGDEYSDRDILGDLVGLIDPDNPLAPKVALLIASHLSNYERNRNSDYQYDERRWLVQWLLGLSPSIYESVKKDLFAASKVVAQRDAWEACYLADLFSQRGDHDLEAEVLGLAAKPMQGEKQYARFSEVLHELEKVALANANTR